MMTIKEIVEETIEYYKTHKRGRNKITHVCEYKTSTGERCAIGRVMSNKGLKTALNDMWGEIREDNVAESGFKNLDEALMIKYRGHSEDFWCDLQTLHDSDKYWIPNGKGGSDLTDVGRCFADSIIYNGNYA